MKSDVIEEPASVYACVGSLGNLEDYVSEIERLEGLRPGGAQVLTRNRAIQAIKWEPERLEEEAQKGLGHLTLLVTSVNFKNTERSANRAWRIGWRITALVARSEVELQATLIAHPAFRGFCILEEDLPSVATDGEARAKLNKYEVQLLDLIASGSTYRQVGEEMVLSEDGVKLLVKGICRKMGIPGTDQIVMLSTAFRQGIIS